MALKRYYPLALLGIFTVIWLVAAISPRYREVWLAENFLTILMVAVLVFTYKKFSFSHRNYTFFFIFLVLHVIGSYYSYSEMPLFTMLQESLELSRNHYDRAIHFLFGLLFYFPIKELLDRKLQLQGWQSLFFPLVVITALKSVYEVLEFGYHMFRETELITTNFLGMQGDGWDTQKDQALGIAGALVAGIMSWGYQKKKKKAPPNKNL